MLRSTGVERSGIPLAGEHGGDNEAGGEGGRDDRGDDSDGKHI